MENEFIKQSNRKTINVSKIITILYLENSPEFYFSGEKHDFWEFEYIDKGNAVFTADGKDFSLKDGEIVFHKPNEFHKVKATEKSAPNLSIVSFACSSSAMRFFENKIFKLTGDEKKILSSVLKEGLSVFEPLTSRPPIMGMRELPSPPTGARQLTFSLLEQFLITLLRREDQSIRRESRSVMPMSEKDYPPKIRAVIEYMNEHVTEKLTVKDFADAFSMSESALKKLFGSCLKRGVTDCFNEIKLNSAKLLVRENEMNLTEISNFLGFSSVHYFSRFFGKRTGMSPTQYRESVKDF